MPKRRHTTDAPLQPSALCIACTRSSPPDLSTIETIVTATRIDRFVGSLVALALGDASGAPHEGGLPERCLWALIGKASGKHRWTDDTQMSIDVAESLLANGRVDQDDLARRFAGSYRWSRGYGSGAARLLRQVRRGQPWQEAARTVYPQGSYGNGGAMRAPVVGLFFAGGDERTLLEAANAVAAVTHAHPLGREGAELIASATALSLDDAAPVDILVRLAGQARSDGFFRRLRTSADWLANAHRPSSQEVAGRLGNGVAAVDSCVTAIYVACAFLDRSFNDLIAFVIELRGDVDTIGAMASAIWGARRGLSALPAARLQRLERYESIAILGEALAKKSAEEVRRGSAFQAHAASRGDDGGGSSE